MITEKDLQEAIAECQGERNPNANTCIKLAAYYTILNQMEPTQEPVMARYSGASGIDSGSEFALIANSMDSAEVLKVMDELMDALMILNRRLYDSTLRKLKGRE